MTSDLDRLADAVCEAVRRHATAILQGTDDRVIAGPALIEALDDYGIAVVNAGSDPLEELDDFDVWLDEEDGIEHPLEEPDPSDRVAVFVRADFAVDDVEALRAGAVEEMQSCCPVAPGEDPADAVRLPHRAVAELLGHCTSVFDHERMGRHGLRPLTETVQTASVGADSDDADDDPWRLLVGLLDAQDE